MFLSLQKVYTFTLTVVFSLLHRFSTAEQQKLKHYDEQSPQLAKITTERNNH